ncbi:nuclear transport factor 2 family protein [Chryseobacterium sp. HR92]|uniref:nuclear transport factor 2 family protein n=1 Tax=Chryseobacterium sp. HR92 TaxID=3094839 RepID=UPI00388F5559|nr:nuclear transport factor 2 family protein [Chryseobacterium sp. HR92]
MIKKLIFAIGFMMAISISAQKISDKEAVNAVAEKFRLAMISGEKSDLESLILPELTYGHSGGHIDDAREFVEKLASKKSDFVTINITNQTVSIVGNTAIVRHHFYATTADAGKAPGDVTLDILLVWVKVKNDWKLLARQAVKAVKAEKKK